MKKNAFRLFCRTAAAGLATLMLFGSFPTMAQSPTAARSDEFRALSSRELAIQTAAEGTVLLENNGALPLAGGAKLAIFGVNQSGKFYAGGGGSGGSNATDITTYADAFRAANQAGTLSVYTPLLDFYSNLTEEKLPGDDLMRGAAEFTDTALVTIGRWSEEGLDRTEAEYYLTAAEKTLLSAVCKSFERVIVSMNICSVTDTAWLADYDVDALLISWMPGQYGAQALVQVLTGEVTPSGKLADTFADAYDAYPSANNFGGTFVNYEEDIFVGYRYFESFDDAYDRVLYPFGYGLSYTTFDIYDISAVSDAKTDTVTVSATVKNTGEHAGKEVVQVYFGHPTNNVLGYAAKELAAFAKTELLQPGEEQTLVMRYAISDMAGYDDLGKIQKSAYLLEAGDYPVYVGTSVRDVIIAAKINIAQTTVTAQLSECGVSTMQLSRRLLADGTYETLEQRLPSDSDTENALFTEISGVGTSILECESYYKKEGGDLITVSNGSLHNTHEGGTLYYMVNVAEDGDYRVWLNTAQGANTGNNCLRVSIDDEVQKDFVVNIRETSGGWEVYRYYECGSLYLEEGEHEIKMEIINGAVGNMESFRICAEDEGESEGFDVSQVNSKLIVYADQPSTLQAEHYTKTTNGSLVNNSGGYLEGLHLGGTITYEIYAEQTADYLITFCVACGNEGGDNAMTIQIDGAQQQHFSLSTKGGTGSWTQFADISAGYITLKAGKNTVVMTPSSGFNPDSFTLTRLPGAPAGSFEDIGQVPDDQIIDLSEVFADPSRMDAFLEQLTTSELMHLVQGRGSSSQWGSLERYGVPTGTVSDGPAGLRAGTYWPVAVMQACTWNVTLLEEIGLRIGQEAYEMGVDIWLAPALNIHRNPLCGRNFEYYAEDPYLSGAMAAAVVSGTQAQGVAVTLKHLAANNCEAHRDVSDSRMSERALREIYLEGFRVALELSDAWGIMTSYNRINSCEPAESYDILTTIIREEWGYEGLIMSDWWNNSNEAAELLAGNNLKMPEGNPGELMAGIQNGQLTRDVFKASARRVLELMFRIDRLHEMLDPTFQHVKATEPLRPVADPVEIPTEDAPPTTDDTPTGDDIQVPVKDKTSSPALLIGAIAAAVVLAGGTAAALLLRKKKK